MGAGASAEQTTRGPSGVSGKNSSKAKKGKTVADTPATARKEFNPIVPHDEPNGGKNPLAPSSPHQAPTVPPSGGGANYAALLQQHQHQQLTMAMANQSATANTAANRTMSLQPGGQQQQNPNGQNPPSNGAPAAPSQQATMNPADAELFSKKATFRQVIKRALELAQEQRQRYGKFRKDEKRAVMELYETLGLDEDTFLAPPNELQKRISGYRFPPPNMHMLRDMEAIDEDTLVYVLGADEAKLRKNDGLEVAPAPKMKQGAMENTDAGGRRVGVSSEGTQALMRTNAVFKNMPKTKDQGDRLWAAIQQCTLFKGLDRSDLKILFDAFEREQFNANTSIFDQGDEGDKFFLIDEGRCHVVVKDPAGREVHSVFLGTSETFGELAIMYGTPRAATVTAVIDTVCWWIDRDTYRGTLLKETMRKRDKYMKFLETVPLFSNVESYEKIRMADVLEVQEIQGKGSVVIREGEPGDTFYLIEEGEVKFETQRDGEVFDRRKAGSFFGEMALLFDRPRMATVITTTSFVRLLTLNRANFTNYLGPLDDILRRNAEQYKHYVNKAQGQAA